MMKHPASTTELRWMIRADLPAVVSIERTSILDPWTEEDFCRHLRTRNCIGIIAEQPVGFSDFETVGFMVYGLHKQRFHLINMAVSPSMRRRGVGRQLVQRIIDRLESGKREKIVCEVAESNLGMQLFLRAMGFRATRVIRGGCGMDDAYRFAFKLGEV